MQVRTNMSAQDDSRSAEPNVGEIVVVQAQRLRVLLRDRVFHGAASASEAHARFPAVRGLFRLQRGWSIMHRGCGGACGNFELQERGQASASLTDAAPARKRLIELGTGAYADPRTSQRGRHHMDSSHRVSQVVGRWCFSRQALSLVGVFFVREKSRQSVRHQPRASQVIAGGLADNDLELGGSGT